MAGRMTTKKKQATSGGEPYGSWDAYIRTFIEPDERQIDVAQRTGIDQTTVSRWLNGERRALTSQTVAKFARAYDRPVLEAFVVAGFLTAEEAGITFSDLIDWSRVSDRELLAEMHRRMTHISGDVHISRRQPLPSAGRRKVEHP